MTDKRRWSEDYNGEVCRVCFSKDAHVKNYRGRPTKECVKYLLGEIEKLKDAVEIQRRIINANAKENIPTKNECEHEWVDATNEVVKGGEVCIKCHAVRATPKENIPTVIVKEEENKDGLYKAGAGWQRKKN